MEVVRAALIVLMGLYSQWYTRMPGVGHLPTDNGLTVIDDSAKCLLWVSMGLGAAVQARYRGNRVYIPDITSVVSFHQSQAFGPQALPDITPQKP